MPETFPEWNERENRLVERDYYSLEELADMLHVSRDAAYRRMRADDWPRLEVLRRTWFSAEDVGAIVAHMRHGDGLPEGEGPRPLGWTVPPDPWDREGDAAEPADQNPGGVR